MKILFLNLPNEDTIIRRFCGSYNSRSFLFPPQELLSCASAVRQWNASEVSVIDSIAEGRDLSSVIGIMDDIKPDMVVTMTGMECFASDINMIMGIKDRKPGVKMTVFGYYPSVFR